MLSPVIFMFIKVNSCSPTSGNQFLNNIALVKANGDRVVSLIFIAASLKKPACCSDCIKATWPGYLSVFSIMLGICAIVYSILLKPSVLNDSKVPTSLKVCAVTSLKAGLVTTSPFCTKRAGLVYSSITSIGEKGALYSKGFTLFIGNPPTIHSKLSICILALWYPNIKLLMPGATPQSNIAVTFFCIASSCSCKPSSTKNEISATSLPAVIIAFKVRYPIYPGTALITN